MAASRLCGVLWYLRACCVHLVVLPPFYYIPYCTLFALVAYLRLYTGVDGVVGAAVIARCRYCCCRHNRAAAVVVRWRRGMRRVAVWQALRLRCAVARSIPNTITMTTTTTRPARTSCRHPVWLSHRVAHTSWSAAVSIRAFPVVPTVAVVDPLCAARQSRNSV